MTVLTRCLIAMSCLLLVAGCVTDELAVFKDGVVKKKEMKPFLGLYKVEEWPGDMNPEEVKVSRKDGKFRFAYSVDNNDIRMEFTLSKIPNSKKNLHLLAIPKQKGSKANIFFVGRMEKEKLQLWTAFANAPVAKGELKFEAGKAKADDVKKFLAKKGDEFVAANKATVIMSKQKKAD